MSDTLKGKTLLKGHTLRYEGAAFNYNGVRIRNGGMGGSGLALCSCGAMSDWLPSSSARRQWHREHKDSLR